MAEDDADMRCLVADSLRAEGHRVMEVADGGALQARVSSALADPIDLIVSDIRMPYVSGLTVVRGLRDAGVTVPVVLMTAFGDESTLREATRLRVVLFTKPFKLDAFRRVVRAILTGSWT